LEEVVMFGGCVARGADFGPMRTGRADRETDSVAGAIDTDDQLGRL
jgi:hypothetical protein